MLGQKSPGSANNAATAIVEAVVFVIIAYLSLPVRQM
jgi:hypothetical protein